VSEPNIFPGRSDARVEALLRETETRLRRHNEVLVELAKKQVIHAGNLDDALREISEAAARTLEVERASIWFFTSDRQAIRCIDLFELSGARHSSGSKLTALSYPAYFRSLETERTITAHDAERDPRTAAFMEGYLRPFGITSMLDAPIRHVGQIAGVVCMEHVGVRRFWTIEEESFASAVADLVAMALDATDRRRAQESLQHRVEFEKLIASISTHFINLASDEIDNGINEALGLIGRFVGADRSYVYSIDEKAQVASITHEWCAGGVEPRKETTQNVPLSVYRWTFERLRRGEHVYIPRIDDLPMEAESERMLHQRAGNRSAVAVPMVYNRVLVGSVGFNSTQREYAWEEESVALLRIVGEIVAGALERDRAVRALHSSEQRHRMLFERNLAGVYRNTVDGRILECNEALAEILGYTREELLSMNASDLYFARDERVTFIDTLQRERTLTSAEICLRHKDGRPVWLIESVHLLDSDPPVLEGTLIDITARKQGEDALRESEARYRVLVERMREGLAQVDNDGILHFVNDRFCHMVGYSREELIGTHAGFLLPFPDDAALMASKTELRKRGVSDQYDVRMRRKDGIVMWMEIGGAPLYDAAGNVIGSIGVHNDVTERRLAEEALRESEARYRLMAENSTDMISRISPQGMILYASDASRRLLGYEPSEVTGRSVLDLIHEEDRDEVRHLARLIHEAGPTTFSYRVRRKDGTLVWFETTSRAILDAQTNDVEEIVSVSRDISERRRAEEQIEYQAYHDALTGLPNRWLFRDRLTVALAQSRRLRKPLAVMFLDLDRFKLVNDTLGHSIGDEMLKTVASRLKAALREEDSIARMGGDEFTVLINDLKNADDALVIAQKLLDVVGQPMRVEGHDLFITTSAGIALFPDDGDSAEMLLKNADHAMYRAKDLGRNAVQLCTAVMNERAHERLSLETALRHALDRDELVVYYQPQVEIASGRVVGMEALLRWNRPGFGIVEPKTFIPVAEDTRLIVPIGEKVLREACRQAKVWQSRYPQLRMGVNLSARQFQHNDLPNVIRAALDDSGLAARDLEVEITETTAMLQSDRTMQTLALLREMGVRISIDDFGTGHSSLNYLRNFPIDAIKIDLEFVREIETSSADRAIVSAIIAMAHGLGLRVTAEGVETDGQLTFLRAHGCHEVQGFLFSEPRRAEEI
jgi:diguanylate cyclase (GGDEF)-like protein/PAS domain S-box-containing protein